MTQLLFGPAPHAEAADFIKSKPIVSRQVFDRLLPEIKARTFLVSALVPLDIAQKLRDRIADLPQGGDWNEIKADLADGLSPFLKKKMEDGSEQVDTPAAERRAELLLRTHGYQAYDVAKNAVLERQKDVFPYWRYQTAQDDRVRESHAVLEGVILPADSPFWNRQKDWGCRCDKVPMTRDDVAEVQADEKEKPADAQSVIAGQQLQQLETSQTITRAVPGEGNMPRTINVSTQGPYAWNDSSLEPPTLDTLRQRYSPAVFAAFEQFAKETTLEDGRTIAEWLGGAEAAPAPVPRITPPAAIEPAVRQSPVSRAFNLATRSTATPIMQRTLELVDQVHDDGTLPTMTLIGRPVRGAFGHFSRQRREIAVSAKGLFPQMTAAHELGHMLDWFALGEGTAYASAEAPALAAWRNAVASSEAIKTIESGSHNGKLILNQEYYLRKREIWARSYAQYIAQKSGNAEMLRQLDLVRQSPLVPFVQWSDTDFAPIAAAIDDLFKAQGWIT